jgi:CRP-like cAMP-binding protein
MLTAEGEVAREVYLLLDGVLEVVVGQETLGQLGPGAIVGERALLEDGRRTASLRALTPCTVAIADESRLDPHELETLAEGHRREDT